MELRPLLAADLAVVVPWFEDAETRRWLGNSDWPRECLDLAGTAQRSYLATLGGRVVGLIAVETYADRRASFANVTAPADRRHGIGVQMLAAMIAAPAYRDIEEFFAGIESGNVASERLVRAMGFTRMTEEDADGFTYFVWRRSGIPPRPWTVPR